MALIAFGEKITDPKSRVVADVDPKIYDDYVGKYQLGPTIAITITRAEDRLFIQPPGKAKVEVFPESQTTFFAKVMDVQITFVKAGDKVMHLVLHKDGQEIKLERKIE